jgi:hypothetical protein
MHYTNKHGREMEPTLGLDNNTRAKYDEAMVDQSENSMRS